MTVLNKRIIDRITAPLNGAVEHRGNTLVAYGNTPVKGFHWEVVIDLATLTVSENGVVKIAVPKFIGYHDKMPVSAVPNNWAPLDIDNRPVQKLTNNGVSSVTAYLKFLLVEYTNKAKTWSPALEQARAIPPTTKITVKKSQSWISNFVLAN